MPLATARRRAMHGNSILWQPATSVKIRPAPGAGFEDRKSASAKALLKTDYSLVIENDEAPTIAMSGNRPLKATMCAAPPTG